MLASVALWAQVYMPRSGLAAAVSTLFVCVTASIVCTKHAKTGMCATHAQRPLRGDAGFESLVAYPDFSVLHFGVEDVERTRRAIADLDAVANVALADLEANKATTRLLGRLRGQPKNRPSGQPGTYNTLYSIHNIFYMRVRGLEFFYSYLA